MFVIIANLIHTMSQAVAQLVGIWVCDRRACESAMCSNKIKNLIVR